MTETGSTRILAPPLLMLAVAGAVEWWNPAGIQSGLGGALFGLWEKSTEGTAAAFRPAAALPAETLALLAASGIAILLLIRLRVYWAGLFTAFALAAGFEIAWTLFVVHHWLIDA